jgi:hypothetical protein
VTPRRAPRGYRAVTARAPIRVIRAARRRPAVRRLRSPSKRSRFARKASTTFAEIAMLHASRLDQSVPY